MTRRASELGLISRHAATVLVGQLAVMAFAVIDTLVAGRYSGSALAALSVGSAIYASVFVSLSGVLQALLPVWAEHQGAGRRTALGAAWRQALYLCALLTLAGTGVLLAPQAILRWTSVPPAMQSEVTGYLSVLALALPAALLFRIIATLNQSLGRPKVVTWLQAGALMLKLPLSIWFAFGGLGLTGQGASGCAWATVVVSGALLMAATALLRTDHLYRPYRIWSRLEAPDWRLLASYLRLGVPGGLAVLVEVTSFTLMALFIARLGTSATAGHQIAASATAVLYMVPLSVAIATSARVGYWIGAADPVRARQSVRAGFTLTLLSSLGLSIVVLTGRATIARWYSPEPDVVLLAQGLLAWVALYHIADAQQALCVFVLRCYRVTIAPLVVYGVLLWGAGLMGGFLLAYHGLGPWPAQPAPATFWQTATGALIATAITLMLILRRAMRRHQALGPAHAGAPQENAG